MKRAMRTLTLAAAMGSAAMAAALPATSGAASSARAAQNGVAATVDPVIQWNRFLLNVQATPGDQPATVHPTYELAMLHAAIHDAVITIDHSGLRYLPRVHSVQGASVAAAADAAAHDTLVKLYPSLRASIDQQYAALLARVPPGAAQGGRRPCRAARRGAAPRPARQRRLERFAPPVPAGHERGRLSAHAAGVRAARLHALAAGQAVRDPPRQPVPAPAAAGAH